MRESEVLLSTAEPNMYEKNFFRVSGASVYADTKEIKRRLSRMEKAIKFGAAFPSKDSIFPIEPYPEPVLIREVLQKLNDPEQRLIHEFFWFWPLKRNRANEDEALQALKNREIEIAQKVWISCLKDNRKKAVALHNLAVIHHFSALELELSAEPSTNGILQQKADNWVKAYKYWRELIVQGAFWDRIKRRIEELDDPRLGLANYRVIENSIPLALLSINVKLALFAVERSRLEDTSRHRGLISASGFPDEAINESLRREVEPIRNRIRTLCKAAEEKGEKKPDDVPQTVKKLLEHTKTPLNVLDEVLPKEHSARIGAHDEVSKTCFQLTIPYINEKKDWNTAESLFVRAKELALSASLKGRIQQNVDIVKKNLEADRCYFCKENQKTDSASISVAMYGEVHRNFYQGTITWRHIKIKVPRCERCRQYHEFGEDNTIGNGCGLSLLGIILAFGLFYFLEISAAYHWIGYTFGALSVVGGFWWSISQQGKKIKEKFGASRQELAKKIKPVTTKDEFYEIKELRKDGWEFGEKPPTPSGYG